MKNYEEMTREQLAAEAERRGLTVTRADGGEGKPVKSDFVDALVLSDAPSTGTETSDTSDTTSEAATTAGGDCPIHILEPDPDCIFCTGTAEQKATALAYFRGNGNANAGSKSTPTPRAKILGRMLAAGEVEPNAPVTYGVLSRIMDMAEDNTHGHAARAEHDEEWNARRARKARAGAGKESGARSLEGNADTRADVRFSDAPVPETGDTQDFFITKKPKAEPKAER